MSLLLVGNAVEAPFNLAASLIDLERAHERVWAQLLILEGKLSSISNANIESKVLEMVNDMPSFPSINHLLVLTFLCFFGTFVYEWG